MRNVLRIDLPEWSWIALSFDAECDSRDDDRNSGMQSACFAVGKRRPKRTKGTLPCPFPCSSPGGQIGYVRNAKPDALALRKVKNAKPSRPVPSRSRLVGSGVKTILST